MALKYHPDKCAPEAREEAVDKFQLISKGFRNNDQCYAKFNLLIVYEVLSDEKKRKIYDQYVSNLITKLHCCIYLTGRERYNYANWHGAICSFH